DVPAKVTGHHVFVHDFAVDGMLHGRAIRPPSVGAKLLAADAASIKDIPGARVVRIESFLGVVADDEWDAVQAARLLKARWTDPNALIGHERVREWMRSGPFDAEEFLVRKGDARQQLAAAPKRLTAEYYWPLQSNGSHSRARSMPKAGSRPGEPRCGCRAQRRTCRMCRCWVPRRPASPNRKGSRPG